MSTLAWEAARELAPAATETTSRPSIWARLIEVRQRHADRAVRAHLAGLDDATLTRLGFDAEAIIALRRGGLKLPNFAKGA